MNRLPAAVLTTVAIAGAGAVAEREHIPPVPAIVSAFEDGASFLGDRAGDVVEVAQDVVKNPDVHIVEAGGTEHTTFDGLLLKEVETVGAPFVLLLGGFGIRAARRRSSKR